MPHARTTLRRFAGAVTGVALATAALSALPAAPAHADDAAPAPAEASAAWLATQLTDGLVIGEFGPDHGLSIDAALALDAVGQQSATFDEIVNAVETEVDEGNYVTGEAFGDSGSTYAGATAKTVVLAQTAGEVLATFGGENFVTRLEGTVIPSGAAAGRIHDISAYGDYANVLGQAFAVNALDAADSALAESATEYLLAQQCEDGFFPQAMPDADATEQTCAAGATGSVDATALAIINLVSQADDTDVQAALDAAAGWLAAVQNIDGSFGSDVDIATANANATGLAGWALGVYGGSESEAAEAAVWLRQHTADDFGACETALTPDNGAITYDDAALASARAGGLDASLTRAQAVRATAQALPALAYAPVGTYASAPATNAKRFVRTGSTQLIGVADVAPGQNVCFARGSTGEPASADVDGVAAVKVKLPAGSGNRTYTYTAAVNGQNLGGVTFKALGAKNLKVTKKNKVKPGKNQRVTVKGLAQGESVKVIYRGKKVASGKANAKGQKTLRFKVAKKKGKAKFRVVGQFGNRNAKKSFQIK